MSYLFYVVIAIVIIIRISRWIKSQYAATLEEEHPSSNLPSPSSLPSEGQEEAPISSSPLAHRLQDRYLEEPQLLSLSEEELKKRLKNERTAIAPSFEEKERQSPRSISQGLREDLHNPSSLQKAFVLSEILQPKYKAYDVP